MAAAVAVTGALSAPEFALYDLQSAPGGGWTAMSAADFNQYKPQFVDSYNANGGLGVVKPFRTGNCCIAVKGGKMLTITGTKYGFQFPADAATGEVKCNPAEGYTGKVQLFLSPKLSAQQSFAEEAKCKLHHNPAVYMRLPRAPAAVEFGVHDFEAAPAGGWVLMGAADFESHRDDFLALIENDLGYVIGNEAEIRALWETDDTEAALAKTAEICPLVVCTRSGDGVTLVRGEERVDVPVEKVVPVDATGAGDQFAAGFLYGLATSRDLETCGRMGNICAGEVIRHIGPRPQTDIMALFKAEGLV